MFSTFTSAGVITAATTWASEVTGVALVIVGASVALGLTGWVIKKMRRAAR